MSWGYIDNILEQDNANYPLEEGLDDHYSEFLDKTEIDPLDPYVTYRYKKKGPFHGKHYYTISAAATKVFQEDQYQHTLQHLIIKKIVHNLDITSIIWGFSKLGYNQFEGYYQAGQQYFKDYLPDVKLLTSSSLNSQRIKEIIETEIGNKISINTSISSILTDLQWCKYKLQEQYNYDIGKDILFYNNKYFYLDKITPVTPNIGSDISFDTIFKTFQKTIEFKFQDEDITISPKDETTDIRTTTKVITTKIYRADTNDLAYEIVDSPIVITEEIPHNSDSNHSTYTFISQEEKTPIAETIILNINVNRSDDNYILVNYTNLSNGRVYYWVYDYASNKYPELHIETSEQIGYEIYPISTVRNNFGNISGKQKDANDKLFRPLNITTDTILEAVAKNPNYSKIRDVYLTFGVSPADIDPSVATILYSIVEFYSEKTTIKTGARFTIHNTTKGNMYPYETNISWVNLPFVEREEKICPIGECRHQIITNTVRYTAYATGKVINNIAYIEGHLKQVTSDGIIISDTCTVVKTKDITQRSLLPSKFPGHHNNKEKDTLNQLIVSPEDVGKRVIVKNLVCGSYEIEESNLSPDSEDISFSYDFVTTERHKINGHESEYIYHYFNYIKIPYLEVLNNGKVYISDDIPSYNSEKTTDVEVLKQINKTTTRTYILQNLYGLYLTPYPRGIAHIKLNAANPELIIPVPVKALNKLSLQEQTKALDNVIYLQIYAYDYAHAKWYTQGAFLGLLQAIVVVIAIVTWQPEGFELAAALEGLAVSAAIVIAVKLIFKFVDNPFLKAILAIAATIAISYAGGLYDGGFGFMDAVTLVNTATEAVNVSTNSKMEDLQNETLAFNERYEKKEKKYSDILKSFDQGLQVEAVTDIATSTNESDTYIPMSPDYFYYQALEAYKNYDLLYDMPDIAVSERTNNLLTLKYSGE